MEPPIMESPIQSILFGPRNRGIPSNVFPPHVKAKFTMTSKVTNLNPPLEKKIITTIKKHKKSIDAIFEIINNHKIGSVISCPMFYF